MWLNPEISGSVGGRSTYLARDHHIDVGELSCSALPVALPFYLTELRKVGACLARKILSHFKLLWFLNVFW